MPEASRRDGGGMDSNWVSRAAYVLGGAGGVLMFAAQTKPEDAASSLSEWAKAFGLNELSETISYPSIDAQATTLGAFLVIAAIGLGIWRSRRKSKAANTVTPIPAKAVQDDLPLAKTEPKGLLPAEDRNRLMTALAEIEAFMLEHVMPAIARTNRLQAPLQQDQQAFLRSVNDYNAAVQGVLMRWGALLNRHETNLQIGGVSPPVMVERGLNAIIQRLQKIREMAKTAGDDFPTTRRLFWEPLQSLDMALKFSLDATETCIRNIKEERVKIADTAVMASSPVATFDQMPVDQLVAKQK